MGWIATLSTGEIVKEPETPIKDALSPWHLLIARCRADNIRITELRLIRNSVLVTAMENAEGYSALYQIQTNQRARTQSLWQGIGAKVGDYLFIIWLDERGRVFQDVRRFESEVKHTTARD